MVVLYLTVLLEKLQLEPRNCGESIEEKKKCSVEIVSSVQCCRYCWAIVLLCCVVSVIVSNAVHCKPQII